MTGRSRRLLIAAGAVGLGLALAPVAFQMFSRAPKGGDMIDEFRPYMDEQTISDFRGYLSTIGAADAESASLLAGDGVLPDAELRAVDRLHAQWPDIDDEMTDMLDDIEANLDNFSAVAALPPFPLFPWFFVLPGLIGVGLVIAAVRKGKRGLAWAVAVLGVGLIAAPAIFQMFTRAPKGGDMINDFRPLMTSEKVTRIQGYFLTIGAAEGEMRLRILPEAGEADAPAVAAFADEWPTISNEMAPMIGAMADNLDNYAAVDALPPFPLFPWFFVFPGLLIAGLGAGAARSGRLDEPAAPAHD